MIRDGSSKNKEEREREREVEAFNGPRVASAGYISPSVGVSLRNLSALFRPRTISGIEHFFSFLALLPKTIHVKSPCSKMEKQK